MFTIPSKQRDEWRKLVNGQVSHSFRNYVLQMKVHQTIQDVKGGLLTESKAIENLHELCSKYALAVQPDLKEIFKTW